MAVMHGFACHGFACYCILQHFKKSLMCAALDVWRCVRSKFGYVIAGCVVLHHVCWCLMGIMDVVVTFNMNELTGIVCAHLPSHSQTARILQHTGWLHLHQVKPTCMLLI